MQQPNHDDAQNAIDRRFLRLMAQVTVLARALLSVAMRHDVYGESDHVEVHDIIEALDNDMRNELCAPGRDYFAGKGLIANARALKGTGKGIVAGEAMSPNTGVDKGKGRNRYHPYAYTDGPRAQMLGSPAARTDAS